MVGISDWIVVAATVVIAGFAVTNYLLARTLRYANEKHQLKMNEILTSLVRSNYYIANSESRKEELKESKEQKAKRGKAFVTQRNQ